MHVDERVRIMDVCVCLLGEEGGRRGGEWILPNCQAEGCWLPVAGLAA